MERIKLLKKRSARGVRVDLVCQLCKKTYKEYPSNASKYCSRDCYYAAQLGKPKPKPAGFGAKVSAGKLGKPMPRGFGELVRKRKLGVPNPVVTLTQKGVPKPQVSRTLLLKNGTGEYLDLRRAPTYAIWRKAVLTRDNYTCQRCDISEQEYKIAQILQGTAMERSLDVHHIQPFEEFPKLRLEISNGLALCRSCHNIVERQKLIETR